MRRALPWSGALGLRGRIVGAVLVATVVTLVVAAVALLGPLEQSLKNAAMKTLRTDLRHSNPAGTFARIHLVPGQIEDELGDQLRQLAFHVGATATVYGYPDPTGGGVPIATSAHETAISPDAPAARAQSTGPLDDVSAAFLTGKPRYTFASIGGTDYARAAIPFQRGGLRYVIAVRRAIDEIPGAVRAVRTAFLYAAAVALVLTMLLGIPLSATIVRRLRRLRLVATQLAAEGPPVEVPVDRARDEVGDLARTFALMQERLRQQEEARRAFVATASHELRTPLASLDGMLELLEDDLGFEDPDLDDAQALLARARAQSRRLGRLAADLLDLSRLDAQLELRTEPIELSELSRAVLAEFELGTTERGILTSLEDHNGGVWALGDPGGVARILRILLDNAVRLSPPGGTIKVEVHRGPRAGLSVSDEGPGVAPAEREVIFERFKRGRDTGGTAGFGLGLAIGRELAQRMGGELILEESEGPGARFTLGLPIAQAPEEHPVAV
jgi:signal transduction histidine kinase